MRATPPNRLEPAGPKVLWVTPNIRGSAGGPTSTVINGLIAEEESGAEPKLVSTSSRSEADESGAVARLDEAGVEYRLFRRLNRSSSSAAWGLSLGLTIWLARNLRRYDVLHLQYVWCWTTIAGCALARLGRRPVVLTPHESLTSYDIEVASRSRPKRLMKRALRRFILRSVDALIFMSAVEERDTEAEGVPAHRVPHAVIAPSPSDDPETAGQPGPEVDELRIGFIGRQTPKKGIDRLIRALGLTGDYRWTLDLAGPLPDPELEAQYRDLVTELGLEGRVRWLGFVDDRDAFLASLDVLVMPSEYEGFGMVAAEAMSCGTPAIVPRESGVADLVESEGGGLVVERPEPTEIAGALEVFVDPARRREIGDEAKGAIARRHSPAGFAAATRNVYEGLAGRSTALP